MRHTLLAAAFLVVIVALGAGCPPPPAEPDAGPEVVDSGPGPGKAGETCLSPTQNNGCEPGLECAAVEAVNPADGGVADSGTGTFACVIPADVDTACYFQTIAGPNPPDDGCKTGLACGQDATCVLVGALGAPCASAAACESLNCGKTTDGLANVCVPNDCNAGCPAGTQCQIAGACGLTCVTAPGVGEACLVVGDDVCSPRSVGCAPGLECFIGETATGLQCGVPGTDGDGCNPDTAQDGCANGFTCDPGPRQCHRNP